MDRHRFGRLHYRLYDGDLFVGSIAARNVGQGDLGDCFFLAALAALAHTRPRLVRRMIADSGDGTYTVAFLERRHGAVRPVAIRVDARFPTDSRGAQCFGKGLRSGPHGQELWPALIEKAYAAWQGGYVHINQGGDGGAALRCLTGSKVRSLAPKRLSADALWLVLTRAARSRRPMVTSTPLTRDLRRRTGRPDLAGLIEGHYYTVLDGRLRGGRRQVRLYPPLVDFTAARVSTPSPADDARRVIEIPLSDYRRDFDQLVVAGAGAAARVGPSRRGFTSGSGLGAGPA
jgi:hypothetical protein